MLEKLSVILDVQEYDIKMIRLMRLKKARQKELSEIDTLKKDLRQKIEAKEEEIRSVKDEITSFEDGITEIKEKIKQFESRQDQVKKIEEFNALNQEISQSDRSRANLEQKLNLSADRLMTEEELLTQLEETYRSTQENSKILEEEIKTNIREINEEGSSLKEQRTALVVQADPDILKIYERLINNKRDRVVVPIANRCCSGCHIVLTAQQENLVRKAERLVFCEHCSRILYWAAAPAEEEGAPKKRRRKAAANN